MSKPQSFVVYRENYKLSYFITLKYANPEANPKFDYTSRAISYVTCATDG